MKEDITHKYLNAIQTNQSNNLEDWMQIHQLIKA